MPVNRLAPQESALCSPQWGAITSVVVHMRSQSPLPMRFIYGNQMVQQLTPTTPDPSLRRAVLARHSL